MNLTQQLPNGAVLDWREDGVIDRIHSDGTFSREQDVSLILKANQEERANDKFKGFRVAPTFRKVASIPVAVFDIAKSQGLDLLNDPEALKQWLNKPENAAFRTTTEKV